MNERASDVGICYFVGISGIAWTVDVATYKQIDDWLDGLDLTKAPDNRFARLTIDTLGGATITFFAGDVQTMSIETPETRRYDRQLSHDLREERREQGFIDDD